MTVATAKDTVREVLQQMPDDCSLEDVQYQLYLRQKLERSRLAAAEGRVVAHAEVKQRLWTRVLWLLPQRLADDEDRTGI